MDATPPRHYPLDGTLNFRDSGGYPTRDGRQTRWGTLFRSDSLHALTPDAQQQLLGLGIRTIIDLRRTVNIEEDPSVFAGSEAVDYRHVPVFEVDLIRDPSITTGMEFMRRILEDHRGGVVAAVRALAAPGALPAVVHCLGGTHRTGVVVALCQALAGVPGDLIATDFALTDVYAAARLAETRARRLAEGWTPERIESIAASPAQTMHELLRLVEERHGGVAAYLRAGGMSDEEIAALRARLVE